MRQMKRSSVLSATKTSRRLPRLELLEDRNLLAANPLLGSFQTTDGLLSLHGDDANHLATLSLTGTGYVDLAVSGGHYSSDPRSSNFDPALAGATGQSLRAIQFTGDAGDRLVLADLSLAGGLAVRTDGVLDIEGQVSASGAIQLSGRTVLLAGEVRAAGLSGG